MDMSAFEMTESFKAICSTVSIQCVSLDAAPICLLVLKVPLARAIPHDLDTAASSEYTSCSPFPP